MKNTSFLNFVIILLFSTIIISSCSITKDYKALQENGTLESYQSFKDTYPNSKYEEEVNTKIKIIR